MYTQKSILFSGMETLMRLSLPGWWHHHCGDEVHRLKIKTSSSFGQKVTWQPRLGLQALCLAQAAHRQTGLWPAFARNRPANSPKLLKTPRWRRLTTFLNQPAEQNATASCVISLREPSEATQRGCVWVSQRGESSAPRPPDRDNMLRCLPTSSPLLWAQKVELQTKLLCFEAAMFTDVSLVMCQCRF